MEDFELKQTMFNLTVSTDQNTAIVGHVDLLQYFGKKIVNPGTVLSNPRDIDKISKVFDDAKNYLNGHVWGSGIDWIRLKNLGPIFFQDFILEVLNGSI